MTLRPYQSRALEQVAASDNRATMICAPTGSGKTVLAAALIRQRLAYGIGVLVLAHRRELLRQPFVRLLRAGIAADHIGIIQSGVPSAPVAAAGRPVEPDADDWTLWARHAYQRLDAPIQIASIATVARRTHRPKAGLVIVDEAHRAVASSYRKVLEAYPRARVIGLSATPSGRTDGRGLDEAFDDLIVVSTYRELARQGYLVIPRVIGTDLAPDLSAVRISGRDYHRGDLELAVDRSELVGDIVEHWQKYADGAPTLVFATSRKHSRKIVERFVEAGHRFAHVDGETPQFERDKIFERLTTGELQGVSNVDVASEGTDLPCVKCVVMARPTLSLRIYLQQAGRGARPHRNGHRFVILDHAGNAERHGLPDADRDWTLKPRKKSRAQPKGLEALPPCWRCASPCLTANPMASTHCGECGAERPRKTRRMIAERAGELRELTPDIELECTSIVAAEWRTLMADDSKRPKPPEWCRERFKRRFKRAWPAREPLPQWQPREQRKWQLWREATQRAFAGGGGAGPRAHMIAWNDYSAALRREFGAAVAAASNNSQGRPNGQAGDSPGVEATPESPRVAAPDPNHGAPLLERWAV